MSTLRDLEILKNVVVHGQTLRHVAHQSGLSESSVGRIYRETLWYLITHGHLVEVKSKDIPLDMLRTTPLREKVWHAISSAATGKKPIVGFPGLI